MLPARQSFPDVRIAGEEFRRHILCCALGTERSYEKGALLWTPDQPCHSVFILKRGEVEIFIRGPHARETVVRLAKPGELCGLYCFEGLGTPYNSGRAIVRTTVIEIPFEDFARYLQNRPEAMLGLLVTACDRLRFAEERAQILACRRAEDRLTGLLLQLAERTGRPSPNEPGFVRIHYTHLELARLSGLNRSHVSVVLGRLRRQQILRYSRGAPMRLNVRSLRQHWDPSSEGTGASPVRLAELTARAPIAN